MLSSIGYVYGTQFLKENPYICVFSSVHKVVLKKSLHLACCPLIWLFHVYIYFCALYFGDFSMMVSH